jgi:hypothetical protein
MPEVSRKWMWSICYLLREKKMFVAVTHSFYDIVSFDCNRIDTFIFTDQSRKHETLSPLVYIYV